MRLDPLSPRAGWLALTLLTLGSLAAGWDRPFWHVDEAITAVRSREMADRGAGLTVHENHEPVFKKPPLYYALSAPFFHFDRSACWPARVVSAAYGLGALALVAWIGARLVPGVAWVPPAAVAVTLSGVPFALGMASAHLDTGVAFYLLAALAALLLRPGAGALWIAGASVALCGLHKFPAPLLILLPAAVWQAVHPPPGRTWRDGAALGLAALLGIAPLAAWMAQQTAAHGRVVWEEFLLREMAARATDAAAFGRQGGGAVYWRELLLSPLPLLGGLGASAVMLAHAPTRRALPRALGLCAAGLLLAWVALGAAGFQSSRYLVPLVPLGALLATILAAHGSSRHPWIPRAWTLAALLGAGTLAVVVPLTTRGAKFGDQRAAAQEFRCQLDATPSTPLLLQGPGLSLRLAFFEADAHRRLATLGDLPTLAPGTPVLVLADTKRYEEHKALFQSVEPLRVFPRQILFRARIAPQP